MDITLEDHIDLPLSDNSPTSVKERVALINGNLSHYQSSTVSSLLKRFNGNATKPLDFKRLNHVRDSNLKSSDFTKLQLHGRKLIAPDFEDNRNINTKPVTIFVGTWNCVYQDFFENTNTTIVPDSVCCNIKKKGRLSRWLSHVVDFRHSHSQKLPIAHDTTKIKEYQHEPLREWIEPGYDIYVISLQETLSSKLFNIISSFLSCGPDCAYTRIELEKYKLSGYGDGAFLHTKSTCLAVWVRTELLGNGSVSVGKSKAIALSMLNHSKGAITLQLKIFGQILCIIGAHLPAKFGERQRAASSILKKIAEAYGGHSNVIFQDVFHHILWAGDFNFRVRNITADEAIFLLNHNQREVLFYNDELYSGNASVFSDFDFEEGIVSFDPTYKKRDDRDVINRSSSDWADREYHTQFGLKWYKGGNVRERVPSWTDRVLKWSLPSLKTCLEIDDGSYRAVLPQTKNMLLTSDHSPVSCGLKIWPLDSIYAPPKRMNIDHF
ncbi:endonuclease/exonuclease/phosphatase family member protein [Theileria equi strain WA]|uniref:Endonuclease/exonuclease/phosphatase family member protein n=1 Tax=Theileria equi strain WA TaxID=1537102 RepID=L1LGP5_THEEQ|nr:endonuclease/exonuclease/phosphatase family member protein [Theileria equi strain WA]EKX74283.1 endonuclease/exonuclease/phosphatase family member protein [Theileria equi strain WA]|eukprot:XP_004833735.1 endonuclease/exonuclease/phosphatase family member protein [Theileria equi strain WA]